MVNKKYDVAITEFKTSIDGAATPDLTTSVRLAVAYTNTGKFDDSVAVLDKVIASPGASEPLKKAAQNEKQRVEKAKAATK
jgi:hypothetical protein